MTTLTSPAEHATAVGEAARTAVPLASHAGFTASPDRPDPVEILIRQGEHRDPDLVPIRYGRMLVSPFTFYRGAAAVMAADLAGTPTSGLTAQLCGDAHLANFGLFASPERSMLFDINDFDETYPGPWEWDVKRLAASLEVAARERGFGAAKRRAIQLAAVTRYRRAMADFAAMGELDVWYSRRDAESVADVFTVPLKKGAPKTLEKTLAKARSHDSVRAFGKLTEFADGRRRITADPPLIVPVRDLRPKAARDRLRGSLDAVLADYRSSLPASRRILLDRFQTIDVARKAVGVGSVGTRCWIMLMHGRDEDDPLFLQVKEAQRSVLADYAPDRSAQCVAGGEYDCEGERVVSGQRLMQAAGDIFLGWTTAEGIDGERRDFYVRQLADWKGSAAIESMRPSGMLAYAELCAWTLARAHARTGDRIAIASYLGDDDAFAEAIAAFSDDYADQNERDFAALLEAARTGRITATSGL